MEQRSKLYATGFYLYRQYSTGISFCNSLFALEH